MLQARAKGARSFAMTTWQQPCRSRPIVVTPLAPRHFRARPASVNTATGIDPKPHDMDPRLRGGDAPGRRCRCQPGLQTPEVSETSGVWFGVPFRAGNRAAGPDCAFFPRTSSSPPWSPWPAARGGRKKAPPPSYAWDMGRDRAAPGRRATPRCAGPGAVAAGTRPPGQARRACGVALQTQRNQLITAVNGKLPQQSAHGTSPPAAWNDVKDRSFFILILGHTLLTALFSCGILREDTCVLAVVLEAAELAFRPPKA
jgi:hypothetical protein